MLVSHDPFAREELHKEPIQGTCDFCGYQNRYGKVWKFWIERDDQNGRRNELIGKFCSKDCLSMHHGF
jgi:hypothetical protein